MLGGYWLPCGSSCCTDTSDSGVFMSVCILTVLSKRLDRNDLFMNIFKRLGDSDVFIVVRLQCCQEAW